jgi:hypothetical protein
LLHGGESLRVVRRPSKAVAAKKLTFTILSRPSSNLVA